MNNLLLTAMILGVSTSLFLFEAGAKHEVMARNRRLLAAAQSADAERRDLIDLLAAARERLQRQRRDLGSLSETISAPALPVDSRPFDPEHEGLWPKDRSYFYLRKSLLPDAAFQRFQPSAQGMCLNPDTVVVLGLTPEQATELDQGFENLVVRFRKLERERLGPSAIYASNRWPRGQKSSYRLPPLQEEMRPATEEFFASARALLEPSQADLFESWARSCIDTSLGGFGPRGRLLTLTDEKIRGGRTLTRFELAEEGGKELYYYELWTPPMQDFPPGFPEEFKPRFPYRHLFGDNGEKRPQF